MKTSTFISLLVAGFLVGAGSVWLIYFQRGQFSTQVLQPAQTTSAQVGDRDGDGILDQNDYFPNNASR